MSSHDYTVTIRGHVKWFDPAKGYGFVIAESGGPDILLHANVLRNFGQSSVADGAGIELQVQDTVRGVQAVAVISITPQQPTGVTPALPEISALSEAEIASAPLRPARVKWFDKGKGFGFANVWTEEADIFIHIEVLRASGLADLAPGEAIALRTIAGRRGLMALEIRPWEAGMALAGAVE
ncbi:MAG: CspA family cold shock protein [Rubellimicrobium sp.]|nr:CspA family cold shock protein [Rubellimicrobium sp.]